IGKCPVFHSLIQLNGCIGKCPVFHSLIQLNGCIGKCPVFHSLIHPSITSLGLGYLFAVGGRGKEDGQTKINVRFESDTV
ncbi:hypothetical protein KKC93_02660, partial [Patescibacteria group bacterium]|nr:hypothetical protein [Patescibacteria group bacterium]